jgi:hypothetical protein
MYGLINDCVQKYIEFQYGKEFWNEIVKKGNASSIIQGGWVINQNYSDEILLRLVSLAAQSLNISIDQLLEEIGWFFMEYTR